MRLQELVRLDDPDEVLLAACVELTAAAWRWSEAGWSLLHTVAGAPGSEPPAHLRELPHGHEGTFWMPIGAAAEHALATQSPPDEPLVAQALLTAALERAGAVRASREARLALETQRRELLQLVERSPAIIAIRRGEEHRLELANAAYLELIGEREVFGVPGREALPEIAAQGFFDRLDEVFRSGEPWQQSEVRAVYERHDGPREGWYDVLWQPLRDEHGAVTGTMLHGTDVTSLVKARMEAEAGQKTLHSLLERAAAVVIIAQGPEHELTFQNRRARALIGDQPLGRRLGQLLPQAAERGYLRLLDHVFVSGEHLEGNAQEIVLEVDGRERHAWFDYVIAPWRNEHGRVLGVWLHAVDITRTHRARLEALAAWGRFRDLVESLDAVVLEADPDTLAFTYVSDHATELFGYPLQSWFEPDFFTTLVHPEDREHVVNRVRGRLKAGHDLSYRFRALAADGRTVWVVDRIRQVRDKDGRVIALRGIMTDVSRLRDAEDQLSVLQRSEALGHLAGGIAHDFNNLLAVILGRASLLGAALADQDALRPHVDALRSATQRASELTQRLMTLAGQAPYDAAPVDLVALVRELATLLEPGLGTVSLVLDLDEHTPHVHGDGGQVQQIVMNLVINAGEALDGTGGVTVRLGEAEGGPHGEPGPWVVLEVEDDGPGMDAGTRDRVFDPFFTTKAAGRGLGLAAVAGVVRGHEGHLSVRSAEGEGTCFTVWLPASDVVSQGSPSRLAVEASPSRILVVDDEASVREVCAAMLRHLGHEVVEASSGDHAQTMLQGVGLVICDLSMPGMSGDQLFEWLQIHHPHVPFVLCTGYDATNSAVRSNRGYAGFLHKPYTVGEIAAVVARALDG